MPQENIATVKAATTTFQPKNTRPTARPVTAIVELRPAPQHPQPRALAKPEPGISPDRRVVGKDVEEWNLAAGARSVGEALGEVTPQSPAWPVRMDADRAELDETGQAEPLPGHRHQAAIAPNPDIVAEQNGAPVKGAGSCRRGQGQHLVGIGFTELYRTVSRHRVRQDAAVGHHLDDRPGADRLPSWRGGLVGLTEQACFRAGRKSAARSR
jgi:hypothetical protein